MKMAETSIAELIFDKKESILYMKIKEKSEMNLENTKEHYEVIKNLTENKRYAALIDTEFYFTADTEALEYASMPEIVSKRIASAYYNSSLANMLTTNFFKVNYKPQLHIEQFKIKEEALEWLRAKVKADKKLIPKAYM